MKNKLENIFLYIAVGIAIGAVICTIGQLAVYGFNDVLKELSVWLIASAVIGLASMVYENENLTDLTATLIHAPITAIVALIAGWIIGYGEGSVMLLVTRMLPTVLVLYALIHLFLFLIRRSIARSINSRLNK